MGMIEYVTRHRIGVRLRRRPGQFISVPKPMLALPRSFRSNDPIAVLYDPEALDDSGFFKWNLWPGSSDPGIARSAIPWHAKLAYPASRDARSDDPGHKERRLEIFTRDTKTQRSLP